MMRYRWLFALAAIATALVLVAADANARAGGGFSGGSRGMRTFSAPPATSTAPNTAAPIQRSVTQPGSTTTGVGSGARPGLLGGGLFGGGLLGGLAAGFIGAGLFGMLFGHGMFGGMGGFASILGLLLQIALVVIVARLLFAWWQRRNAPQEAYAAAHPATGHSFGGLGSMLGGGNAAPAGEPLTIDKADYDAFERLLGDVQAAYSAEDLAALRREVTPEMLSYFSEQLS
jgi:predicted lipid-binding transport protein (Tim44 family)